MGQRRIVVLGVSTVLAIAAGAVAYERFRARSAPPALDLQVLDERAFEEASKTLAPRATSSGGGLLRAPLDEQTVRRIVPMKSRVYDPYCYVRAPGDTQRAMAWREHPDGGFPIVTNSLGLRQDREIRSDPPDLRILVAGDSHIAGVCANAEALPARLETLLSAADPERSVEVINGAHGGYGFYNYLGVLERMLALGVRPDLFVLVVYGGNDFLAVSYWHLFHGSERPLQPRAVGARKRAVLEQHAPAMGQVLNAVEYFDRGGPAEVDTALRMGLAVTREAERIGAEAGCDLLVVYLPAPSELPDHADLERVKAGAQMLRLRKADFDVLPDMGDRHLAALRARGIPCVDLRAEFRRVDGLLYWERDLHLNLTGHRVGAEAVARWVEAWWQRRSVSRPAAPPPSRPDANR